MSTYPDLFPADYHMYLEPFLGSASTFFLLQPSRAILSDANKGLMEAYCAVRADPKGVRRELEIHQISHSAVHYYNVRARTRVDEIARAADFIYLNRTCWNGLYRVNKQGQFNVPIGTKQRVLLPNDDFDAVARVLGRAKLLSSDFEEVLDAAGHGDFVFIDPPYTVRHDNNGFVKYNENIFRWSDQCRLRLAADRASGRGALLMVTNANHSSIRELYGDFGNISEVTRYSVIAGGSRGRAPAVELVIRNYK